MIRPVAFSMNPETASNNHYQHSHSDDESSVINAHAQQEFDAIVKTLVIHGVQVHVVNDTPLPLTPDSLFPNNWISFHGDKYVLYPMQASNRRLERRIDFNESDFQYAFGKKQKVDFAHHEGEGHYLEGTGSLVLDRINKLAYASLSERTSDDLVREWCNEMEYSQVIFHACQTVSNKRVPIYHTNVMMSIATDFAIVCADAIDDVNERKFVLSSLEQSGRELILISEDQVNQFLGNALELQTFNNKSILVMSDSAFASLQAHQKQNIEKYCEIVHSSLQTIEKYGGGSARCMIAEVF